VYAQIKSKNCTEVASSGGGSSATGGDYAPPVPSATLKKLIPLGVHHHSEVAADIPVPTGTPVYAFTNGTIATVFRSTTHIPYAGASGAGISGACGTGLQMRATDGNTYTYCHMSSLNSTIEKGATLKAGDSIGLSGNTGYTEGPHLHLGAHGAITAAELRSRIESTVK
jgi:murein DD-endopeptidase MepM/ murein hydrolase activator NlpD